MSNTMCSCFFVALVLFRRREVYNANVHGQNGKKNDEHKHKTAASCKKKNPFENKKYKQT